MSAADDAYEAARAEIARVKAAGGTALDFNDEAFRALDRIPPEIAELDGLKHLDLDNTQIRDLSPLQGLSGLQALYLDHTQVSDIAPLQGLSGLQWLWLDQTQVFDIAPLQGLSGLQMLSLDHTQVSDLRPLLNVTGLRNAAEEQDIPYGLYFEGSAAAEVDPTLRALSEIEDDQERTLKTLDHLATLPEWPAPLAPHPSTSENVSDIPEADSTEINVPTPPLTVEAFIAAQDLAGWRFSPVHSSMELFVRDTPLAAHQEQLARMAGQRLAKLLSSLGNRTNAGGLRQEVFEEASHFKDLLEDSSRPLSARSLELWGSLIALGDLLDANELSRKDGRDPLDLLAMESRAALQTFLGIAANLVRSFPEARALDEDYGGFSRRQVTREMILTLIEDALRSNMVNPESAALIQHVAEVGDHVGPQADKAFSVSVKGTGNLILAAALAVPLYFGGTIADGILTDIGTEISDHYKLGERAIEFLENSGLNIEEFLDSLAPDEKARLKSAVEDARRQAAERGHRRPR